MCVCVCVRERERERERERRGGLMKDIESGRGDRERSFGPYFINEVA